MSAAAGAPPGRALSEWQVGRWLNVPAPLSLAGLRGRVVVIEAFQMLCPGCVQHGLPQLQRVADTFDAAQLQVIGLHTVFEHHAVQGSAEALAAFVHENRIRYPVGIDAAAGAADEPLPRTMADWGLRGTPSLLLVDGEGVLREHHFGAVPDLVLGAQLGALVSALH